MMTQHNHRVHVEGCFRCELSKDEIPTDAEHIAWLDDEIQWLEHEMEKWEVENKRLRDGIREHQESSEGYAGVCFFLGQHGPRDEDVYRAHYERNQRLYALLDEPTETR